jgi:hypothetical protein
VSCWSFPEDQGNWGFGAMYTPPSSQSGAPNAYFSGSPQLTNYSHALTTPVIDATEFSNIKLSYILYINSNNSTSLEQMFVEYKAIDANNWLMLEIFSNTGIGSGSQQYMRFDQSLPGVQGQHFQVRFRAQGANSSSIQGWGLDDVTISGDGLTAGITIVMDAQLICEGDLVTFTAQPVNGGDTPVYQWFVNGDEAGENTPEFAYYPEHGDMVCCELTSNMPGVIGSPVMSDVMALTVHELPVVTWATFVYDTVCYNWGPVALTGGLPEGGEYHGEGIENGYFHPTIAGPGLHEMFYTYTNSLGCENTASVLIWVDVCSFIDNRDINAAISIFPNPASGIVYLQNRDAEIKLLEVHLTDLYGRRVSSLKNIEGRELISIDIENLPQGIYVIEAIARDQKFVHRIIIQ